MKKILISMVVAMLAMAGVSYGADAYSFRNIQITNTYFTPNVVAYPTQTVIKATEGGQWKSFGLTLAFKGTTAAGNTNVQRVTLGKSSSGVFYENAHVIWVPLAANASKTVCATIPFDGFPFWRINEMVLTNAGGKAASGFSTNMGSSYSVTTEPLALSLPDYTTPVYAYSFTNRIVGLTNDASAYLAPTAVYADGFNFVTLAAKGGFHAGGGTNSTVFYVGRSPDGTAAYAETGEQLVVPASGQTGLVVGQLHPSASVKLPITSTLPYVKLVRGANFDGFTAWTNGTYTFQLSTK